MAETLARKRIENDRARDGRVPLPHHRRSGRVPRDGPPLPPAPDRRGRARDARAARRGGGMTRENGRRPDAAPRADDRAGLPRAAARLGAHHAGQDDRALHGDDPGGGPALAAQPGPRLDDRRVLAAAGLDRRPRRARGVARQAAGPHGRDPAPDRPRGARGRRLPRARRADDVARLRRAAGGRRHALRGDLRRLRRRPARARPLRPLEGVHRLGRGRLRRRRRRRAAARPRLRGGLERRHGHERRHDRRRPARSRCRRRPSAIRSRAERLDELLALAEAGIAAIGERQAEAAAVALP